ncbi:hypothetical protein F4813DRAFT_153623 [Daldinia decipiens]|uniref:uncharacterized protein n=1 Tax=Daldinia decipiens TaxID=326647 RepID=UPI0020C47C96|nr:uncharacterized protein F4813DRAFT_153623 [Daldinia decipiens]KAI1655773.1 hypothetical protein F4813DRAFT_153623 [Daldinia decipiens]
MTPSSSPTPSPPPRPRFRLEFRTISDGQDTARAQALTRAGHHAHHSTFPQFPLLPPELRLKIWEYLLAPRIVAVACIDDDDDGEEPLSPWPSFPALQVPPPSAVPALLLVNHETRELARQCYEPAFAWKVPYVFVANSPSHGSATSMTTTAAAAATWSRPRVWFDYERDALYLVGELEPCDSYGFNSAMAYFLRREEALRVRRLAVAFGALRYGEAGSQHIFGALFHVVDRFAHIEGGRVLVAVVPRDEFTHLHLGGEWPLVRPEADNVVQNIWKDWYRGTSALANAQFELVPESDLPELIARPTRSATTRPWQYSH